MIVVDTSVLVSLLRGQHTAPAERLRWLEREGVAYAIPWLCCQEILAGAKNEREWRLLASHLEAQLHIGQETTLKTHVEAARIFYDCRRRGLTVRSMVDCLIAQQVMDVGGTLLHEDADYDRIARVRELSVLRS